MWSDKSNCLHRRCCLQMPPQYVLRDFIILAGFAQGDEDAVYSARPSYFSIASIFSVSGKAGRSTVCSPQAVNLGKPAERAFDPNTGLRHVMDLPPPSRPGLCQDCPRTHIAKQVPRHACGTHNASRLRQVWAVKSASK